MCRDILIKDIQTILGKPTVKKSVVCNGKAFKRKEIGSGKKMYLPSCSDFCTKIYPQVLSARSTRRDARMCFYRLVVPCSTDIPL